MFLLEELHSIAVSSMRADVLPCFFHNDLSARFPIQSAINPTGVGKAQYTGNLISTALKGHRFVEIPFVVNGPQGRFDPIRRNGERKSSIRDIGPIWASQQCNLFTGHIQSMALKH